MFWRAVGKFTLICIVLLQMAGFFWIVPAARARVEKETKMAKQNFRPGEVLVKFRPGTIDLDKKTGQDRADALIRQRNFKKKFELNRNNLAVLESENGNSVEAMIDELEKLPEVEYAQPNYIYEHETIYTNDTYRHRLWGLDNTGQSVNSKPGTADADIDAPEAWNISEGDGIIVAVIDTGVAYEHPDLKPNMWDGQDCRDENDNYLGGCNHGYDFDNNDKTPLPSSSWHGTHVAGIIGSAKNNNAGIIGVAPQAELMAIKTDLSTGQIVKGIYFAKYNGAKVINASWGCYGDYCGSDGYNDLAMIEAIGDFPGLFVNSAGNGDGDGNTGGDNHDKPNAQRKYPCDYPADNIICVAATDQNDNLAVYSDYGPDSVDVGAPGSNIYSTIPGTDISDIVYFESFNSSSPPGLPGGWSKSGNFRTMQSAEWGSVLYGDSSFPYSSDAYYYATSPRIDLGGSALAAINFTSYCDTEYIGSTLYDYMGLAISADGQDFAPYYEWDEGVLANRSGSERIGAGVISDLDNIIIASDFRTSDFRFRFSWTTNSENNYYEGCWVDSIDITEFEYNDGSDNKYAFTSGTSMAAPHVAGLAALIWGYRPSLNAAEVKAAILNEGDSLPGLSGKTVSGKRINAQKSLLSVEDIGPSPIEGCTDSNADNFDPNATVDDGSCEYLGCTDPNASNYDLQATLDDGSCYYLGCTDPNADNYDPNASQDDGSCEYTILGCIDPNADNYNPSATVDDGTCEYFGCTDSNADNYDPGANQDDGSCYYLGCTDSNADNYDPQATQDNGSCEYLGCTDSNADNYDPQATQDNGSCEYLGCTDSNADNYDPQATIDDGSCEYMGCTDTSADNYDSQATIDDGSCEYPGCTDSNADNYDPQATIDDGSCEYMGCTDTSADNYDPQATIDDGSCEYLGCTDSNAANYDPSANQDDGTCEYLGCTDTNADNYDSQATIDDGTCEYSGCTDSNADNYDLQATIDDGTCDYLGCTDTSADNYDSQATIDDGSCEYPGCTDPNADNYDSSVTVDDGSCIYSGCTDSNANNYDPQATQDDGSCEYLGCTDPNADNYDPNATQDDGSCDYSGCIDPNASNYNPHATQDDGSCLYTIFGCTDTNADNFDLQATQDDGSCEYNLPDISSPVRDNASPSGEQPSGTTQKTIQLTTYEDATCRYSTQAGLSFASSTNVFSTTGSTTHSSVVSGLNDGENYNYYVRCVDVSGNSNENDYIISFSIAEPIPGPPASTPSGGGGGSSSYKPPVVEDEEKATTTPEDVPMSTEEVAEPEAVAVLGTETEDYSDITSLAGLPGNMVNIISQSEAELIIGGNGSEYYNEVFQNIFNKITSGHELTAEQLAAIKYFIEFGTPTTHSLGAGERAGVLNSYFSAFNKFPSTINEWQDVVKIANGRWPGERNTEKEKEASGLFKKIYLSEPDLDNPNDNAAVTVIAYGLRPGNRNMDSEKAAILIFKGIFKYYPSSAVDWDMVRAIAYSGATR